MDQISTLIIYNPFHMRTFSSLHTAVVAIALLAATFTTANAQVSFGLRAGVDLSKASFDAKALEGSNRAGFVVGPVLTVGVPLSGFNAEIAALYHNRSVKGEADDLEASSTLHAIDVPITAKYAFGLGSLASFYLGTGPQFSWNIGSKSVLKRSYSLKSSQFSWNFGAGFRFLTHFQIGYNFNLAIGDTAEADELGTYWEDITGGFKNNTHQVLFTYYF